METNIFLPQNIVDTKIPLTIEKMITHCNSIWMLQTKYSENNKDEYNNSNVNENIKSLFDGVSDSKIKELAGIISPRFFYKFNIFGNTWHKILKKTQESTFYENSLFDNNNYSAELLSLTLFILVQLNAAGINIKNYVISLNINEDLVNFLIENPFRILIIRNILNDENIKITNIAVKSKKYLYQLFVRFLNSDIEEDILKIYFSNLFN